MRRIVPALALILVVACGREAQPTSSSTVSGDGGPASGTPTGSIASDLPTGALVIDGSGDRVTLRVEIAETDEDRQRGLMGRTELEDDAGMVFLFEGPTESGFWMKDTLIPLSIAFWGEDERIAAIMEMEPCREDPCPVYRPGVTYIAAVEANGGFFDEAGVEVGDDVELER